MTFFVAVQFDRYSSSMRENNAPRLDLCSSEMRSNEKVFAKKKHLL